jgi:hypothetical protein
MKAFLNVLWEFDEIKLRNSRFRFDKDAIRVGTSDSRVFVFFAVKGCEVISENG